jgi:hypothetical protein
MKAPMKIFGLLLLLSLLLASCDTSKTPAQNIPHSSTSPALPSATFTLVTLPTVTIIPTSTLQPALNTEDASKLAVELLRGNSDCRLPCWWGITPSETRSQDARSFLNSFSKLASTNSSQRDDGSMRLRIPNGKGLLYLVIEYDGNDGVITNLIVGVSQLAQKENGDYQESFGDPVFVDVTKSLALSEILFLYGQPDQILVATYSLQPLGVPVSFDVQLFYPRQGLLIAYQSLMEFSGNQQIKGCPSKSNIVMSLWEPGKYSTIQDVPENIRNSISSFPLSLYLGVDRATNMSIQDFYEAFKDDGTLCVETPASLWPVPGQ